MPELLYSRGQMDKPETLMEAIQRMNDDALEALESAVDNESYEEARFAIRVLKATNAMLGMTGDDEPKPVGKVLNRDLDIDFIDILEEAINDFFVGRKSSAGSVMKLYPYEGTGARRQAMMPVYEMRDGVVTLFRKKLEANGYES